MAITLGERLSELLEDNYLTAAAFSEKTGLSTSGISQWIREESSVKLTSLLVIASFFDCSVDYICGRTDFQGKFNPAPPDFPARLVPLIEKSGKTKTEVFKALGMNRRAFYDWQNGFVPLSSNLIAFADYFGVTVDYLIGIEE